MLKMVTNSFAVVSLLNLIVVSSFAADLPKIALNADREFVEKSTGRTVIFHGLAYVKKHTDLLPVSNETIRLAATEWGSNAARIGFVWNILEPTPGIVLCSFHILGLLKHLFALLLVKN